MRRNKGSRNKEEPLLLSREAAQALVDEIERLRAEVAQLEARVAELDELAYQDPLVQLPNRRCFFRDLEQLIRRTERYEEPSAMIFVDVDGLKRINDQFGHEAGDAALIEVARILAACARKSDIVARLAGDEFGILMPRADELGAWQMALRIVEESLQARVAIDGRTLPLSVAVGVGLIEAGDDPQTVISRADKAMYRIKAS